MQHRKTAKGQQRKENSAPDFYAYYVNERGEESFWTKVGASWFHGDNEGLNIDFDVPVCATRIVLRVPKQDDKG